MCKLVFSSTQSTQAPISTLYPSYLFPSLISQHNIPKTSNYKMFGQNSNQLYYDYTLGFNTPLPPQETATTPAFPPPSLSIPAYNELDLFSAIRSEVGYTSSGCSSYGVSPSSIIHSPILMQRSISSHSLHRTKSEAYSPMNLNSAQSLFEIETSPPFILDELQDLNLSPYNQYSNGPLSDESIIIESISRAYPYSPEEKRERIERYRSKRNLRNFNKKIKYECRKTLADSRPRIRGRFARQDVVDKTPQSQWDTTCPEEDDEEEKWIHFLDSLPANLIP